MSSDPVRSALRATAEAHQPDRAAILARIRRGQATGPALPHRRGHRRTVVRVAGMAAAVVAALGLSAAVTWAALSDGTTRKPVQAASATARPAPTVASNAAPGLAPSREDTIRPPSAAHASRSPAASPESNRFQRGFLWSRGTIDPRSIDNWAQGKVTLRNSQTMTALQVRVRIARTPYVSSTGAWSTVPVDDLVTTVEEQPDALVYLFTLKPGAHLAPGEYVFGVQYNHAVGGRHPSRDHYQATATAGGTRVEVEGGF
jgi:hypothetical protein